jgi:hypothetical protein
MPEVIDEPFNPKKIYEDLITRCKEAKAWYIRCIVDESFVGYAPFDIIIENGIFNCRVVAPSLRDAYIEVANQLPVIKFLKYDEE